MSIWFKNIKYSSVCKKCNYVDQAEIKISNQKLYTSHIGTCSVLAFSHNNKNFLAHIDAIQNNETHIINKIKNNYNINELHNINIYIYKGPWCYSNCLSTNIIINSLNKLKLNYILNEKKIKWNQYFYIKNKINII